MIIGHYHCEQIYRDYYRRIYRYIGTKVRCAETVADLTQDTFIRFFLAEKKGAVKEKGAYLYRIARNIIVDHIRAVHAKYAPKYTIEINEATNLADDSIDLDERLEHRLKLEEIGKVVSTLSGRCQRIFWLSRFYGYKNREIAEREGICLSTVEKNISRVLKLCQENIAA